MPDPIGSEFGLAADEISYGSSLEEAVRKLAERTRQPDVELFAATVRLQAKTGGNLASLLKVTRLGVPLTRGPEGVIPEGCYYTGTSHPRGLDSRYGEIGFVCRGQILGLASDL